MGLFPVVANENLKQKYTDAKSLKFGKLFTDYMLTWQYTTGQGWHDGKIEPYADFKMDPASMVLHYGQAIFEGLKAYKRADGKTLLFRARDNFRRMNASAERLCMPTLDVEQAYEGLCELLRIEDAWIPDTPGTSLYIRPTMIATDPFLGVKASDNYLFFIILSPVGPYYPEGFNPVKIYVENDYVRAVKGGTGTTKSAGNYAASILAGEQAKHSGYTQVLWLDGVHRRYIEEVGAMNIFFRFRDELVTPALAGSILAGITRSSILTLAQDMGLKVSERAVAIDEVFDAHDRGDLLEVFGSGTAAVVSPVGEMKWQDRTITINGNRTGELAQKLYDQLTGIQLGKVADPHGWVTVV